MSDGHSVGFMSDGHSVVYGTFESSQAVSSSRQDEKKCKLFTGF